MTFNKSYPLGSVVTIEAKVSYTFSTSMEVFADVWIENIYNRTCEKSMKASIPFSASIVMKNLKRYQC
ncbi:MAG: hotdog domain-containing protein [Flavobacteriales bacterium AspAUS03]